MFRGGSYKSCRQLATSSDFDCHHLIARGALLRWYKSMKHTRFTKFLSYKSQNWAPSIMMTHEDHMKTLSYCGRDVSNVKKKEAHEYIETQSKRLIEAGDIIHVLEDEVKAIEELFGSKYKEAIEEMWLYFYSLNPKRTETLLTFINPNIHNFTFRYVFSL